MFEEKIINLVISQTDYDSETAIKKLEKWDGDYIKVVKEYLNPNFQEKKKEKEKTTNQMMMSSIRNFMDDVYKGYELRKKQAEEYKKNKEREIKQKESLKKKLEFINEINNDNDEPENITLTEISDSN